MCVPNMPQKIEGKMISYVPYGEIQRAFYLELDIMLVNMLIPTKMISHHKFSFVPINRKKKIKK